MDERRPIQRSRDRAATGKRGFSVLEAIIVLAITGMALTMIFSIGSRASDQGFRLGRRALAVNDRAIAVTSYQLMVAGISLPRPTPQGEKPDLPFVGQADSLSSLMSMPRATVCTPAGRVLVKLSLATTGGRTALFCQEGSGPARRILDFSGKAHFSYSLDGRAWIPELEADPQVEFDKTQSSKLKVVAGPPTLFVRLSTEDGGEQIIGVAPAQRYVFRPDRLGRSII